MFNGEVVRKFNRQANYSDGFILELSYLLK